MSDPTRSTLVCVPGALTPEENRERPLLFARLAAASELEAEDDTGLRWRVRKDAGTLADAARLVALESRCCGFLEFRLEAAAGEESFRFEISGPPGTRAVLRHELELPPQAGRTQERR
jgi:hypothetical protein